MINRVPVKYNIDLCWNGCDEPASEFFVVVKNSGRYKKETSGAYNKYGIGYCSKCGPTIKAKIGHPHSRHSDTQYVEVSGKAEVIVFQVMEE